MSPAMPLASLLTLRLRPGVFLASLLVPLLALLPALSAPTPEAQKSEASPRSLLLVASRRIDDPHFARSVVLVTRHGGGGPIGMILNRPTEHSLGEVFEKDAALRDSKSKLYLGGPVALGTLVFVFRAKAAPEAAVELLPGLYMSLDAAVSMRRLREEPDAVRVFAGYAGWGVGQLEKEIAHGDWHLLPADAESVFSAEPHALWERLLQRASLKSVRGEESQPLWDGTSALPEAKQTLTLAGEFAATATR